MFPNAPIKSFTRLVIAFVLAAMLLTLLSGLAMAAPPAAKKEDDCDYRYEVKRNDTLSSIGKRFGIDVRQIVYYNDWDKPYTIYVGQSICINESEKKGLSKIDSKYANAVAVYFTAGRAQNDILVYTYNYPKTTVIVKVDDAGDAVRKLVTVGTINISSVGNKKALRFRLPSEVRNAGKLMICLKDKKTSHLQCVYTK